ncbi:MAG: class II fructose-bisphosphatase [Peptostreptococcaceae bacterium]|nr:class II fructose-bisphosphatase [Peptostreptococcaceae bacterium]
MHRNLALNLVRVTEAAAMNAAKLMGRGDKNLADQYAVDAMRKMFDTVDIEGTVVIGEGEMDEAPMLYIGEKVGNGAVDAPKVDIAVDPLDGTACVAKGLPNAVAVIAVAPEGCLLKAPDMYMKKIAAGPKARGVIDLNASVAENLRNVGKALDKDIEDLTVIIQDRERHLPIIEEVRKAGARIRLFQDGDVISAISTCFEETGVDLFMGTGGAPEGVIGAAAIKCLGGEMQGQLVINNEKERKRCEEMGADYTKVLTIDDLVKGDEAYFVATGISEGDLLRGVRFLANDVVKTHSVVFRGTTGTIRFVETIHRLDKKPDYAK